MLGLYEYMTTKIFGGSTDQCYNIASSQVHNQSAFDELMISKYTTVCIRDVRADTSSEGSRDKLCLKFR